MSVVGRSVFNTGHMHYCDAIKEILGSVCEVSVACLDFSGKRKTICSASGGGAREISHDIDPEVGDLLDVKSTRLSIEDMATLSSLSQTGGGVSGKGHWFAFECRFASGTRDIIAVFTSEKVGTFAVFLKKVWPGLRRMSLHPSGETASDPSDDAMLWMVSQKVNASILVLDRDCRVLRANAAGRELLSCGTLIQNTARGLSCARSGENKALRLAIEECLQPDQPAKTEYIIILRGPDGTAHLPMSLSPFVSRDKGIRLFLAMLPMPPDQKRIEGLAIEIGLTPSEARVAALIRTGLSNRKAAEIAGLKIETFNTYAKRALAKMNVSCRAEMAQMLTWQASMERSP